MLDYDLADLYDVGTKVLNQAVKRNADRFPDDFMFRLTSTEWDNIRTQFVALNIIYFPHILNSCTLGGFSGVRVKNTFIDDCSPSIINLPRKLFSGSTGCTLMILPAFLNNSFDCFCKLSI